jgi:hypothetical protein
MLRKLHRVRPGIVFLAVFATGFAPWTGCVPVDSVPRPTLNEVRAGNSRGPIADDTRLQPNEIQAEVDEVNRANREILVITEDGRRQSLPYDLNRTEVIYHGWKYTVNNLEAGDIIAYVPGPQHRSYVEAIHIQQPVQARTGHVIDRRTGPPQPLPRTNVVEGTVESIQYGLGVFDIMPRTGRSVTVSVPYNARPADVESFRRLRRGDHVSVEGEFVNPDSLQLLSFLSSRDR